MIEESEYIPVRRQVRAKRRHHVDRLKKKRANYFICYFWLGDGDRQDKKRIGQVAETPKRCSCEMCGNPRKYFKQLTVQERKNAGSWRI